MTTRIVRSAKSGVERARAADAHKEEVNAVFNKINKDLKDFDSTYELSISRAASVMKALVAFSNTLNQTPSEYFDADHLKLTVECKGVSVSQEVAKWKQHVNGYPCVLSFEGENFTCGDADDLLAALDEMFQSVTFGRAYLQLVAQIESSKKTSPRKNDGPAL